MTEMEQRQMEVFGPVKAVELGLNQLAECLRLSYRLAKRPGRYREPGEPAVVHGKVGCRSRHAEPQSLRQRTLARVREHDSGDLGKRFGLTLAARCL